MVSDKTPSNRFSNLKAASSETAGTLLLLTAIVGSNSMAERLAPGNKIIAALAGGAVTGLLLANIIHLFRPLSGAHFNPAITLAEAAWGRLPFSRIPLYLLAQLVGAVSGVWLAHAMFSQPLLQLSHHARPGGGQWLSEAVATFGLVFISLRLEKRTPEALPWLVGGFIAAGHWFTASSSFANPIVTFARIFTDTPAGIRPSDVPGFLFGQAVGAVLAVLFAKWLE